MLDVIKIKKKLTIIVIIRAKALIILAIKITIIKN